MMDGRRGWWMIGLLIFNVILLGAWISRNELAAKAEREEIEKPQADIPTGIGVNRIVERLIEAGREAEVVSFYAGITGNRTVAMALVAEAVAWKVPLNGAAAVAAWESGFDPALVQGRKNANGTRDVGVMGLNSATYKDRPNAQLATAGSNIALGVRHLATDMARSRTWLATLAAFNGGTPDGRGQVSFDYLTGVLAFERRYDTLFAARFGGQLP